jgi:hypothetical protein
LNARWISRFLLALALGAGVCLAAGCVHPLGPGYHFPDRQAEIRVSDKSPGRIQLRVTDELVNAGDRPLHSLEVRLPEGPAFGERNLSIRIDGVEVSPQGSSPIDPRMMSAPFDPVWKENETRSIVTDWELRPRFSARGTIVASAEGFFIADETALPLWQTPLGVFPRGGTIPGRELLTVTAPSDFRVLVDGRPAGQKAEGNQVVRRFRSDSRSEYRPYVIAGRYQEKIVHTRQADVQFWTFRPVDAVAAQTAATRFASSMKSLEDFFGPASAAKTSVRVAESPVDLPGEFAAESDPGGASFPRGVLLDQRDFQHGLASEPVLQLAEYELTRTWYGWRVRPSPEAQILMGRGVGLFGLVLAAEGRGADQRVPTVALLIERYDEARAAAPDRRLMEPPEGYSRAERISTGYRGALFFVALEDECGHGNLKTALRDILSARASSDTGYEDLRAALETASGKDLAEMFRKWLVQPGIPDEFRSRYTKPSKANAPQ